MTDMKETLPKSGHVNEVCKEWLVREDGALAYHLQNQEINEFYNGNKFRNAVVRQDFPTALHEQIKEKEDAERKAVLYHRMMMEQEQGDAELAKKISERLEKEHQYELTKECRENESMARLLQKIYIENADEVRSSYIPTMKSSPSPYLTNAISNMEPNTGHQLNMLNKNLLRGKQTMTSQDCETIFHFNNSENTAHGEIFHNEPKAILNKKDRPDITSCIRQYNLNSHDRNSFDNMNQPRTITLNSPNNLKENTSDVDLMQNNCNLHKLSPEKFDYLMRNLPLDDLDLKKESSLRDSCNQNDSQLQGRSIIHSTRLVPHLENVSTLKEFGISNSEIHEIGNKIEQEKKDEELALRLQREEQRESLTQEERDRLLAIEAQDKELAKMLQEREKAKARRAKEKARLKKSQSKMGLEGEASGVMSVSTNHSPTSKDNFFTEKDSYSNPIDLIPNRRNDDIKLFGGHNTNDFQQLSVKDDDIYTLPIESEHKRLHKVNISQIDNQVLHQRSVDHNLENIENIATVIDPTYTSSHSSPYNTAGNLSPLGYDSSTAPPYMPIQGTRRSASLEAKKKKTKDKCTHQ